MKKFSLNALFNKDLKIAQKKKIFFIIPSAILLVAIIFMAIYAGVCGSPLNLGMEFSGGYVIQVSAGTRINEENYSTYQTNISNLVKDYVYETDAGTQYKLNLESVTRDENGENISMRIEFKAPDNIENNQIDALFDDLIPDLLKEINALVAFLTPTVTQSGTTYTATYSNPIKNYFDSGSIENFFSRKGIQLVSSNLNEGNHSFNFTVSGTYTIEELTEALTINDDFAPEARFTDMSSKSVAKNLVIGAITAILVSLILMFFYIFFRFDIKTAIATTITLMGNVILTFLLMTIFRVQLNSTFMAVLMTVLGLSTINLLTIFSKIKENSTVLFNKNKNVTADEVVNKSAKDVLFKFASTALAVIVLLVVVAISGAISGATGLTVFAIPVIFGIIISVFTSICVAPSLWSILRKNSVSPSKSRLSMLKKIGSKKEKETTTASTSTQE